MQSVSKAAVLVELGYGGDRAALEALLETEGLSRPGRTHIHPGKLPKVKALLAAHFAPVCQRGDCQRRARASRDDRRPVTASTPDHCVFCNGSVIQSAVDAMVAACERVGWRRIAVVGGSPKTRTQFREAVAGRLALHLIDGTVSRSRQRADADLGWADHLVVWGATQLAHKVSGLYMHRPGTSTLNRRSVEELAQRIARAAREHACAEGVRG